MTCPPLLVERIKTRKIVENETLFTYLPFERQDSGKEKKKGEKENGGEKIERWRRPIGD